MTLSLAFKVDISRLSGRSDLHSTREFDEIAIGTQEKEREQQEQQMKKIEAMKSR